MMDVAILKKKAEAQGWTVDFTSNGHLRFFPPEELGGGYVHSVGLHSRDWHAIKNTVARLKRRGLRMDGQKKAAPSEAMYLCVDCGYSHPYEEMMLVPRRGGDAVDPRPTRYCKEHFKQRKVAGRHEQIERDRQAKEAGVLSGATATLTVTPPAGGTNGDTPSPTPGQLGGQDVPAEGATPVMGESQTEEPAGAERWLGEVGPKPAREAPLAPGTMRALEATMQDLTEALLGGLADLERRVDARLSTIEQVQTDLRAAAAAARAKEQVSEEPAPSPEVVAALEHFSQQLLWLAQFDEGILPLARKEEIARGEAAKLATRLW